MWVAVTSEFHPSCCYFIAKKLDFFIHLSICPAFPPFDISGFPEHLGVSAIQYSSIFGVTVQLSQLYRSIDSTAAAKNRTLFSFFIFQFHTQRILFSACQACTLSFFMSLSVLSPHDPRYLKSSTFSNSMLSFVFRAVPFVSMLYAVHLVFFALRARPTFLHSL